MLMNCIEYVVKFGGISMHPPNIEKKGVACFRDMVIYLDLLHWWSAWKMAWKKS
jgi:hypothetical protein